MNKINVVLVLLNNKNFKQALNTLNFSRANLIAIIAENIQSKSLTIGDLKIPIIPFSRIQDVLYADKNFFWLINGFVNNVSEIWTMKKFLMNHDIYEDNIINFEVLPHINLKWLANLRYIEKNGADFFATGISYTEVGLDLNYIPHARGRGVNLSSGNQDLRQGYLTAKHVFEHVAPGTIKFVLIGLAPYSFRYENAKDFSVCSRNFQYMLALKNFGQESSHDFLLKNLVSDDVKNIFKLITEEDADLNFSNTKVTRNVELPLKSLITWEAEIKNVTKKLYPDSVEKNFQILKDYIKLCLDNGAKPIGVVFPFSVVIRKNYSTELLTFFRSAIHQLEESYDFKFVDLFDLNLGYDCFYNMAHLNMKGAAIASSVLGFQLYENNLLPIKNFCSMSYNYFNLLSSLMDKDDYNEIMSRTFKQSIKLIRRKNKIKIGFVLYDSSMWCGDELYNFFANDERFEPTIFLCLRVDKANEELIRKDFLHGVEQFKSHNLNVIALDNKEAVVPAQDILIFLTPYFSILPKALQFHNLTARTLITYVTYSLSISMRERKYYNSAVLNVAWKVFFPSIITLNVFKENSMNGLPHGISSGYPRMDIFFNKDAKFHFDWKRARPNAKKIIYAPHWSINEGVKYATFQWNYKFMYEFAKAHPEISWVVKPHPNLFFSAVKSGLFESTEAFKKYLQAWDDLPNAQVYTGAYYQDLFATSDGMIHDSGSFIAEYQYINKPMIYLTRDTQKYNDLGEEILKVSYLVDGKDLDAIAATMQTVFIEGKDYKAAARKKTFDKYLNYLKANGMLASEFIYKSIVDDLEEEIS